MSNHPWDIDGYLLGDPTVDREAIEQKMLDDPAFALQVAEAAEQLSIIARTAAKSTDQVLLAPQSSRSESQTKHLPVFKVILALAATLLIAVAIVAKRGNSSAKLDDVANNWIELKNDLPAESSNSIAMTTSNPGLEFDADASAAALATSPDGSSTDDWLLDSAVIFFSESGI
jgi:hypothetical protein